MRRTSSLWLGLIGWFAFVGWLPALPAQELVLSEFMAGNATGPKDADGEFSDWIEVFNPTQAPVPLRGWFLTDDRSEPTRWRFPAVAVPPLGFLLVFASGKDRTNATAELHANFRLDRDGEYLALVRPDGVTPATEFNPTYPRQVSDLAYGSTMSSEVDRHLPAGVPGRLFVPGTGPLPAGWTAPGFDDAAWTAVMGAVGYDRPAAGSPEPPEAAPDPGDVTRPDDFIVPTSVNSPGNEGVANAIDNQPSTKYLNFDKLNAGLTVTPAGGRSTVTGLRLTSANDAPDRDPTSFVLLGSDDGRNFTEVARGKVPDFTGRFTGVTAVFSNTTAWTHYRLLFPTVRNAAVAVAVQIAEVELLGWVGGPPAELAAMIRTPIEALLFGRGSTAALRLSFELATLPISGQLAFGIRAEDGFVAWLNGVEVARANAPAVAVADSLAVTNRLRRDAAAEIILNLTDRLALLRPGRNVLALLGLNSRADSRDFLLEGRLEHTRITLGPGGYLPASTPGAPNPPNSIGLVEDVAFSRAAGFFDQPVDVALSCPTPGATIRFTTNGSIPTAEGGVPYTRPLTLSRTTPLRAAAFRGDWRPSRVATRTFFFFADIVAQDRASALAAGFPATWGTQAADYGLDRRVIGANGTDSYGGKYARSLKADLQSLPTVSLVMPVPDLFGPQGIYANPESRGEAWERATSIEWIEADGTYGFQEDAGIRIQGGAFRRFDLTLKKSFRVVFRERYGRTKLRHALFGPDATGEFDNFVLRANSNDAWPYGGAGAVYVRDAFAMETARASGIPSSHTRFAHLYINGQYWGLYNPVERPDAAFSAAYLGGEPEAWDSINQDSAPDGNYDAWNRLQTQLNQDQSRTDNYQRLQGNAPDGSRQPAYEDLLEVDNMIDYLILNFYVGNTDWPGRNWWAGRNREGGDGFTFRPWDTETALGTSGLNVDVTGANGAVARPYAVLRSNADFRLRFADHVQRHFFNGGPLYVNPASPRWDPAKPGNNRPAALFARLAEDVRRGVVGESARWGDQRSGTPFTRDEHWQTSRDGLLTGFFPQRSAIVLEQFRRAGLLPRTDAPVMSQHGGSVPAGFRLTFTGPVGATIHYTTNGTDPRLAAPAGSALRYDTPIPLGDAVTIRARALVGQDWSALTEARFVVGVPDLVLSELHYHPDDVSAAERAAGFADADDFEFIELHNRGTGSADLAGVRFTTGIQFDFAAAGVTRLAAGGYALIVRRRAAFEARYGMGLPVVGEYSGRLDNSGERIVVVDAAGGRLFDFSYGTGSPWPASADGDGPSLEAADPGGDLNLAANWLASVALGGTPGADNAPVPLVLQAESPFPGFVRFRFKARAGQGYTLYSRSSLTAGTWQVFGSGSPHPENATVETIVDVGAETRVRFFRLSIP